MRVVLLLSMALLATQVGCWVRTPTVAPTAFRSRIGSTAITNRDLYLVDTFDSYTAEPYDEYHPDRKYVAKLPRGSEVKVEGIVSRLLPAGQFYFFVCRSDSVSQRFDVMVRSSWEGPEADFLCFPK